MRGGGGGGRRGPARRGGSLGAAGWGTTAEMMPVSGKGVEFASSPSWPGAAEPGGGTPCLFLRRMERAAPPSSRRAPASRDGGRRGCGGAVRFPAGGGAAGHRCPWLLRGHDLLPLLSSARCCRQSRARRFAGRDRSRAASPRALPSRLPDRAPSPPPGALLRPRRFRRGQWAARVSPSRYRPAGEWAGGRRGPV